MDNKNDEYNFDEEFLDDVLANGDNATKHPNESILRENWDTVRFNTDEQALPVTETPEEKPKSAAPKKKSKSQKTRPQPRKGSGLLGIPHLVATCIWIAVILVVGVSLGRTIWVCCADLMAFGKPDQAITITITESEVKTNADGTKTIDIDKISDKLAKAGLIEYPQLFKLFATLTGKDQDISVGTFTLNSYFDYNAMINGMAHNAPAREVVKVLVPEGYNCAQIFALLEEHNVCSVKDLEEYAANGELDDYWFLEGVPRGDKYCLEGYLFPDTYEFYTNDSPRRVLQKFLNDFNYRFTDLMKEDFELMKERYAQMMAAHGYSTDYIAQHPLTMHQLVTLASIVEKESSNGSESFDVASVFYNRLANGKEFPFLDSDATVHYAIGDYFGDVKKLTQTHLDTVSPYNTRNSKGLPPGPICNPGIYSLYAVLDPNETNYHYFVLNPRTGLHEFSRTYAEHQKKLKEFGYTS